MNVIYTILLVILFFYLIFFVVLSLYNTHFTMYFRYFFIARINIECQMFLYLLCIISENLIQYFCVYKEINGFIWRCNCDVLFDREIGLSSPYIRITSLHLKSECIVLRRNSQREFIFLDFIQMFTVLSGRKVFVDNFSFYSPLFGHFSIRPIYYQWYCIT